MNELAVQEKGGAVVQQPPQEMTLESLAMQMATNSALDPEKMVAVMEMLERGRARENRERFFEALARVQAEAPRITKNGIMDRGAGKGVLRYAKLEDVDAVMRPIYQKEGFSVTWDSPRSESLIRVVGKFTAFGHTEEREWSCSPDTSGGKQNPQAAGSTVSYGKRYISIGFWNIITEDSDQNGQTDPKKVTPITQSQADDILSALTETKSNLAVFLKLYNVEKIGDLVESQLEDVWRRINNKRAGK